MLEGDVRMIDWLLLKGFVMNCQFCIFFLLCCYFFRILVVVLGIVALVAVTVLIVGVVLVLVGGFINLGWIGVYEVLLFVEFDAHDVGWSGVVELLLFVEL